MPDLRLDIVVVGAGMVGSTFAAQLGSSDYSVVLIDAHARPDRFDVDRKAYDLRVSAISPGSKSILSQAGAWKFLDRRRLCPYQSMHVWDAGSDGAITFDAAEMGEPCLGYLMENEHLRSAALRAVDGLSNVSCLWGTKVDRLDTRDHGIRLELSDGRTIETRLLVAADGGASATRQQLGVAQSPRDYHQSAVVCEVETEYPHQGVARQRFLSSGPLAFLPLANGHCSIVWSCDPDQAQALVKLEDGDFAEQLTAAFDARIGAVRWVGKRRAFPLKGHRAARFVARRAALIGDAAHVVHPLAGQGVNLGFQDSESLVRALGVTDSHSDPGSVRVLRRYERERRSEAMLMSGSLDLLLELFRNEISVVRELRGIGLNLVDKSFPIKRLLAARALRGNSVSVMPPARGD